MYHAWSEVFWDCQTANLSETLMTTNWKWYVYTINMLFNQKHVLHVHSNDPLPITHDTDTYNVWCQSPSIFQMTTLDRKTDLLHIYHTHASMLTSRDAVFPPDEQLQGSCNSFTMSKCQFKFGNLQICWYYCNDKPLSGLWETISRHLEDDFITSILALKLHITGSRQKYVSNVFEYL